MEDYSISNGHCKGWFDLTKPLTHPIQHPIKVDSWFKLTTMGQNNCVGHFVYC